MLHHKSHKFCGVTANVEEVETILLDEGLKGPMSGNAYPMAVRILKHLSQCDKRLNISTRAHDLDDDVEAGRRFLAGLTTQTRWDVSGREYSWGFGPDLSFYRRSKKIGKPPVFGVDIDADSANI
jgi:hypothetical protein